MKIYFSVEQRHLAEDSPGSDLATHLVTWPENFPFPMIGDVLFLGDDADVFTVTERCLLPGPREVSIKIRPDREDLTPEWIREIFSEENLI